MYDSKIMAFRNRPRDDDSVGYLERSDDVHGNILFCLVAKLSFAT